MAVEQNSAAIGNFSSVGLQRMKNFAKNPQDFQAFMEYCGRMFKQPMRVALEFYNQKPKAQAVATEEQWKRSGFSLKSGASSISFYDNSGGVLHLYDFAEIEEEAPLPLWTVHSKNIQALKEALNIRQTDSLLGSLTAQSATPMRITNCMSELGISPQDWEKFRKSYQNTVGMMIAGRLAIGGSTFSIVPDVAALKLLKTDEQRFAYLCHASQTAREALMNVEFVMQKLSIQQQNERMNDKNENAISGMDNPHTRTAGESSRNGTSRDSEGNATEQSSELPRDAGERNPALGSDAEGQGRNNNETVHGSEEGNNHGGGRTENGDNVPVQSAERSVRTAGSTSQRTDIAGGTAGQVRDAVDAVHEGESSHESGMDAVPADVSDGCTVDRPAGGELQDAVGETVRRSESTPDNVIREDSGMETVDGTGSRTSGDDRQSVASSHNSSESLKSNIDSVFGESQQLSLFDDQASATQEAPTQAPVQERPKRNGITRAERLYRDFTARFPEIANGTHSYEHYESPDNDTGIEPLSVEHLYGNRYSYMMFYEQEGDLMRDPDFEFELDHEKKELHVFEYQLDGVPPYGSLYENVVREDDTVDTVLQAALENCFLDVLKHSDAMERELTRYTDAAGEEHLLKDDAEETPVQETEENTDKTPHLREVLNAFSEKHGLGELNLIQNNNERSFAASLASYELMETFADKQTFSFGSIHAPSELPFTPETLTTTLQHIEQECERRNTTVANRFGRLSEVIKHGGVSALPKVQENLPEITYAESPWEKLRDNLAALREINRLEECEEKGEPLYDEARNQPWSKVNSDKKLRGYSGWGGLPQVFDEGDLRYSSERKQLKELLTPEQYAEARASTNNAHYTPQVVIDAMYKALGKMDLPRDSRILEPACGTGNFIGRCPNRFGNGGIVGVELDSNTAKIAKYLADSERDITIINSGFENTPLENNSFDLAIGNVPFGDYKIYDPDYTKDWLIHDAFFRRALDKVAAGGIVAFVTSSGTMDKQNPKVREYLATQAELVGAIRLPNNTFADAGTKVTSDIIFLQKRKQPLTPLDKKPDWCYTVPVEVGVVGKKHEGETTTAYINSYFAQNPQMVLGTIKQTTHFDMLTCEPFENKELKKQLDEAISHLDAKLRVEKREKAAMERAGYIEPWGKNFTFQVQDDGKVYYRVGNDMTEITGSAEKLEQIKELCALRNLTRNLVDLQRTTATDEELQPIRQQLTEMYDQFVEKYHRHLSEPAISKVFGNDADYPILYALESIDEKTKELTKADIFTKRTVNPKQVIMAAASVEEALQISLDQKGKVDIPYMTVLLQERLSAEQQEYSKLTASEAMEQMQHKVVDELLEKGYIFRDPEKIAADKPFEELVERSEYLSGNVRRKLAMAHDMADHDDAFLSNVNALKEVIPDKIYASEIDVSMGCTWISPQDYELFLQHLSGRPKCDMRGCSVQYSPATGTYAIPKAGSSVGLNVAETSTYGTADFNMYELCERILNQRRICVLKTEPSPKDASKTVTRTDAKATKLALDKANQIREEFKKWIFSSPERKEKYEEIYNRLFNSLVGRSYHGDNLTFDGKATSFNFRPHQLDCIARTIYGGNTLAAHCVGAGKSAVIAGSVMKKKELGLIHKACVVVPKPLTEQTERDWRKVFPDAKLLVVTAADLSDEKKREIFTARVATGNYDAVIMSQEQFEKLSMSKVYQGTYLQDRVDELRDALTNHQIENGNKRDFTVKQLEALIKATVARLQNVMNPKTKSKGKDNLISFESLGFDYLVVDEAHAYKNGFVSTKMTNVAGVTTKPSGRADDMQMKCDYFNDTMGNGHILFCTGTPVSNSMTELYVMNRYLRPDILMESGTDKFDEWAATFGNVVTKNQQTASGTLQLKTSFASFKNLPELMTMYKDFADIRTANQLDYLKVPKLKGGKIQIVEVDASPEQREYVKELAERAKKIAAGIVHPTEDNLLKITSEARLIGLGTQAVEGLYKRREVEPPAGFTVEKNGKIDKCVENVARIYKETEQTKGVQIIFSDIAVNSDNGNFSAYEYLKKELIAKGIPEDEIIFAPKSDVTNRADIFRDINESKYRVVIASTNTLGTGANIQQHLYALHHLDIPWKPSDFEQREGRIIRQGNMYDEVEILNYVTKDTLDSYLYQTVTNKARFIAQLWNDKCPARVMEDCDDKVLSFGELQAAAEGNPDLKKRLDLQNDIVELKMLRTAYYQENSSIEQRMKEIPALQERMAVRVQQNKADIQSADKMRDAETGRVKNLTIIPNNGAGTAITDKEKINEYLMDKVLKRQYNTFAEIPSFKIGSFTVSVQSDMTKMIDSSYAVNFVIKGEREQAYLCSASAALNSDNCKRLMNFFSDTLTSELQSAEKMVQNLDTELKQSEERLAKPFPHEQELSAKETELAELEAKLTMSGYLTDNTEVVDASENADEETFSERTEREAFFENDKDDFNPMTDNFNNHQ